MLSSASTLRLHEYALPMSDLIASTKEWIDLKCHPSMHSEIVESIRVFVRRSASAELQLTFRVEGDISQILIPSRAVPRFNAELWRHTCFEAFISLEGQREYHEFNFAPSGEWAVFAFSGYRIGGPLSNEQLRPHIVRRSSATRLELDATVRLDGFPPSYSRAPLRIGLSAVMEARDGYSYWALAHPADKPDFHNVDGFALLLDAPPSS